MLLVASCVLIADVPLANVANEESAANIPRSASVVTSVFLQRRGRPQRLNNNPQRLRTVLQYPQLLYGVKSKAYHRITSFQGHFSHQHQLSLIRGLPVSDILHGLQPSLACRLLRRIIPSHDVICCFHAVFLPCFRSLIHMPLLSIGTHSLLLFFPTLASFVGIYLH